MLNSGVLISQSAFWLDCCHGTCGSECSAAGAGKGDPVSWCFFWQLLQGWGANTLYREHGALCRCALSFSPSASP